MRVHWKYLCAVLRHKRFVYEEGRKLGLGRWQLLIHDWSKFTPRMWGPYARTFYGPKQGKDKDFDAAWLWHQRVERHHWQWYVLMEDSGKEHCLKMPHKYMLEMVADWRGANRAYGTMPLTKWYHDTVHARKLHPTTLWAVEHLIYGWEGKSGTP